MSEKAVNVEIEGLDLKTQQSDKEPLPNEEAVEFEGLNLSVKGKALGQNSDAAEIEGLKLPSQTRDRAHNTPGSEFEGLYLPAND